MQAEYERFRDGFREALDARFYPIEWLDWMVSEGRATVISSASSAVVIEVRAYPSGARAVVGICGAGCLGEIVKELIPAAEAWGRRNGCAYQFMDSREAWKRILEPHGYAPYKMALMKEL